MVATNTNTQIRHYLLCGLPFSGKSLLGRLLADKYGLVHINLDEQKAAFGYADTSDDDVPDDQWAKIFEANNNLVRTALTKGEIVVHETASTTREWRDRARKVAQDLGFASCVIFVDIAESVIWERWQQNSFDKLRYQTPKNVLSDYIREFEQPSADENILHYDGSIPIIGWLNIVKF